MMCLGPKIILQLFTMVSMIGLSQVERASRFLSLQLDMLLLLIIIFLSYVVISDNRAVPPIEMKYFFEHKQSYWSRIKLRVGHSEVCKPYYPCTSQSNLFFF